MRVSALILAAGMGTRLEKLTQKIPKAMVPMFGKPLIKYQIDTLLSVGITEIGIATGYCSEKIEEIGYPTFFNKDFKQTNMVESLFSSLDFFSDCNNDLLISYGDIVYQKNNLKAVLNSNDDISLMIDKKWHRLWSVRNEDPLNDAETLKLDDEGFIIELGKKPNDISSIQGQYTGLIYIKNHVINDLINFYNSMDRYELYDGRIFKKMFMTSFLQSLIDSKWKIKATMVENGWLEVDTVKDLEIYSKLQKKGKLINLWDMNN